MVLSVSNGIDEHKPAPFISCVGKGGNEHRVKEEVVTELKPARRDWAQEVPQQVKEPISRPSLVGIGACWYVKAETEGRSDECAPETEEWVGEEVSSG